MKTNIGILKLPINRLHVELTNICNFSCEFCPDLKMRRPRTKMPLDMVRAIMDEVGAVRMVKLVLFHIMGEPLLYPHLIEAARYARKKNIEVCITTNGSLMSSETLEGLIDAGVSQIILSLQTPDEKTFRFRGAKGISFKEYTDTIIETAGRFLKDTGKTKLTINFLSSPLRKLIIPVLPEMSIADRSADLRNHLTTWAEKIAKNTSLEINMPGINRQIGKVRTFRENKIQLTETISFNTRILGDWSVHFSDERMFRARFGHCPGLQENFGILSNGDYVFCCTDFDGKTSTHNFKQTAIMEYLNSESVQKAAAGFRQLRIVHPHCQRCIGDKSLLNTFVRQIGSIAYFKFYKKIFN